MFNFASENLIGTRKTQEDYCENLSLNDGKDFLMVLADGMAGIMRVTLPQNYSQNFYFVICKF